MDEFRSPVELCDRLDCPVVVVVVHLGLGERRGGSRGLADELHDKDVLVEGERLGHPHTG